MNNHFKTFIITISFVTINSLCFAQTTESDTTKQGVPGRKTEVKANKKIEPKTKQKDTLAPQNKITVNDDGVEVRKKVKRKKNDSGGSNKSDEKAITPKNED